MKSNTFEQMMSQIKANKFSCDAFLSDTDTDGSLVKTNCYLTLELEMGIDIMYSESSKFDSDGDCSDIQLDVDTVCVELFCRDDSWKDISITEDQHDEILDAIGHLTSIDHVALYKASID